MVAENWGLGGIYYIFILFLRGFAEWMFIIGVYGVFRELFTKPYSWIPFLSELAMPFYLTHQQILVPIASGASWVPYLSNNMKNGDITLMPISPSLINSHFQF